MPIVVNFVYIFIGDVTDLPKNQRYHFSSNNSVQGYQNTRSQASQSDFNVRNNQKIQISAKHSLQNAVAMATSDPITKILPHHQIPRKIWGKVLWYGRIILNCLKLQQTPPPPPPQAEKKKPYFAWFNAVFFLVIIPEYKFLIYHIWS